MSATKKPTGLTISRNGNKFTFEWKIADKDYGAGQELEMIVNKGEYSSNRYAWDHLSIGKTTTKKAVTISMSDYYPTTKSYLSTVTFRVRGKRKKYTEGSGSKAKTYTPAWSAWAEKTFTAKAPDQPSLTATLDSQHSNITTFAWSLKNDVTSAKIVNDFEYQSILVKNCTETNGANLPWKSSQAGWKTGTNAAASGTATGSVTITEDTSALASASYTRWVRVKARGAKGSSAWKYTKHVYATSNKAGISDSKASETATTTTVTTTWTAQTDAAHPIDSTTVEYLITTPASGLAVPTGASWTEANVSKDTSGTDSAKFTIGSTVGLDQCIWVRVKTQHDGNVSYSEPELTKLGKLTAPTQLSVTPNSTTYRAVVSATNNSTVPDSQLAIIFRQTGEEDIVVGIIAHGQSSATVQCPEWESTNDISFGVYAFQGTTYTTQKDSLYTYKVNANMASVKVFDGGTVPGEPTNVTCELTDTMGEVAIRWGWSWVQANSAEISWSQNPNAWESTEEPSTYTITNLNEGFWRVSGLETGVTWYFRVRLANITNDAASYGPYSDVRSMDLSSAPAVPVLTLSDGVITNDGSVTAAWVYVTTDNTPQAYAEICQLSGNSYTNIIAHTTGEQHITLDAEEMGWTSGNEYNLCVRVTSESGKESEWSDPVTVYVAEPLTCTITSTSLTSQTIVVDYHPTATPSGAPEDLVINAYTFGDAMDNTAGTYAFTITDGVWTYNSEEIDPQDYGMYSSTTSGSFTVALTVDPETATENALTVMPLTATITGAGSGGTTTLTIERLYEYKMERPDGEPQDGYEGETVAILSQMGEAQMSVNDLIGALDDGAYYRLIATVSDDMGQSASASTDFIVRWSHQAGIPGGTVSTNGSVCVITPTAPAEYASGDVCDIYRLSADKPALIISGGTFGTAYVDPYPAIGEGMGYRIVHRTVNGDYITANNQPAWTDLIDEAVLNEYCIIIDFNGERVVLPYNIGLNSRWTKDFKVTSYLGGAQQGDWNPVVTRTATYTVSLLSGDDTIMAVRRLADYHGICHIRTPEGSSYNCNIDVSENQTFAPSEKVNYTITATRVDPETLDGLTFEEWSA